MTASSQWLLLGLNYLSMCPGADSTTFYLWRPCLSYSGGFNTYHYTGMFCYCLLKGSVTVLKSIT